MQSHYIDVLCVVKEEFFGTHSMQVVGGKREIYYENSKVLKEITKINKTSLIRTTN